MQNKIQILSINFQDRTKEGEDKKTVFALWEYKLPTNYKELKLLVNNLLRDGYEKLTISNEDLKALKEENMNFNHVFSFLNIKFRLDSLIKEEDIDNDFDNVLKIVRFLNLISEDLETVTPKIIRELIYKKEEAEVIRTNFEESSFTSKNKGYNDTILQGGMSLNSQIGMLPLQYTERKVLRNNEPFFEKTLRLGTVDYPVYFPARIGGVYLYNGIEYADILLWRNTKHGVPTNLFTMLNLRNILFSFIFTLVRIKVDISLPEVSYYIQKEAQARLDSLFFQKFGGSYKDPISNSWKQWEGRTTLVQSLYANTEVQKEMHFHKNFYMEEYEKAPFNLNKIGKEVSLNGYLNLDFGFSKVHKNILDPTGFNVKGDYVLVYNNEDKVSLAEKINPFIRYDKQAYRRSSMPHMVAQSYKKIESEVVFMDLTVEELTTDNGAGIVQVYPEDYVPFEKVALEGYHKGITRTIPKDSKIKSITAVIDGKEVPINIYGTDKFSREIYSLDMINSKGEDPELNYQKNEIFINYKDKKKESLGFHRVLTLNQHFIRKPEFTTGVTLGREFFNRISLLDLKESYDYFLKDQIKEATRKFFLEEGRIWGKRGIVAKAFEYHDPNGVMATTLPDPTLKRNEVRIEVTLENFKLISRINKNITFKEIIEGEKYEVINGLLPINPSIDNTQVMFIEKIFINITGINGLFVNPSNWRLQDRDFDGDLGGVIFLPNNTPQKVIEELQFFKWDNLEMLYPEKISGDEWKNFSPLEDSKNFETFKEEVFYYANKVKGEEFAKKQIDFLYPNGEFRKEFSDKEKLEFLIEEHKIQLVTLLSKYLIGVSKKPLMDALMYLQLYASETEVSEELKKEAMKRIDILMTLLVQKSIDLMKWSENFKEVLEATLLIQRMGEAINILLLSELAVTYPIYNLVLDRLVERGNIIPTKVEFFSNKNQRKITYIRNYVSKLDWLTIDKEEDYLDKIINMSNFSFDVRLDTYKGVQYIERYIRPENLTFNRNVKFENLIKVLDTGENSVYQMIINSIEEDLKDLDFDKEYLSEGIKKELEGENK